MSRASDPVTVLSVLVNGTTDFVFGDGASFLGDAENMTFRASAIGSGAVGAVVSGYRGCAMGGGVRYDDTPAVVFTLSGNNISTDSQAFVQTGDKHWRWIVSGITEATTVSLVCQWWQR